MSVEELIAHPGMLPIAGGADMKRRHETENKYCSQCRCTTKHAVSQTTYTCIRCGSVKYPSTRMKAQDKNSWEKPY